MAAYLGRESALRSRILNLGLDGGKDIQSLRQ